MNLLLRCKECLGDVNLTDKDLYKYELNDKGDYATCWTCKHCKTKHVVQIDSYETDEMVKKITKLMAKMASRRSRNLSITTKTKESYLSLVDKLNEARKKLNEKYKEIEVEKV